MIRRQLAAAAVLGAVLALAGGAVASASGGPSQTVPVSSNVRASPAPAPGAPSLAVTSGPISFDGLSGVPGSQAVTWTATSAAGGFSVEVIALSGSFVDAGYSYSLSEYGMTADGQAVSAASAVTVYRQAGAGSVNGSTTISATIPAIAAAGHYVLSGGLRFEIVQGG